MAKLYCTGCGEASNKKICDVCGVKKNTVHKYCEFCGNELSEGAAVCPQCKESVKGEPFIWNILNILCSIIPFAVLLIALGEGQPFMVIFFFALSFVTCLPFVKTIIRHNTIGNQGLRRIVKIVRIIAVIVFFSLGMNSISTYIDNPEGDISNNDSNNTITETDGEPSIGQIIKNGNLQYPASNDLFKYNVYDTYVEITEYIGDNAAAEVVVPAELEGLPVYVIDHEAFTKCEVKSIVFEEGIFMIHSKFSSHLESVTLPSTLDFVGALTFENCYNLKNVVIPEGIDSIQYKAFEHCQALEEITIPSTVDRISAGTFSMCLNLKTVNLPEGMRYIDDNAFTGCEQLKTIILPSTLEEMGAEVFLSSGMEYIEIPESVKEIGSGMFSGCESLKEVKVYSVDMQIHPVEGSTAAIMFSNCPEDLVVHGMPASTIAIQCGQENVYFEVMK